LLSGVSSGHRLPHRAPPKRQVPPLSRAAMRGLLGPDEGCALEPAEGKSGYRAGCAQRASNPTSLEHFSSTRCNDAALRRVSPSPEQPSIDELGRESGTAC